MTKTELVMRNYTQKIALAKLALFIGAQIANGQDYEDLQYTYRRADQIQALFDTNIVKIEYDEDMMHDCVATLHHILGRWLPKGELGIVDSINVPVGTLTAPPAVAHEVYYGWADTGTEPTVEQIEGSSFILAFPGTNYSLPFQEETEYKYLWFAEPITEPIKTDWEDPTNPLNKGQIGGGSNLFKSPVEIGDYRFYISNYATVAEASLTFKSGGEVIPDDPTWITPSAPQVVGDDVLNTLSFSHAEYPTEIVVSENGGTFEPYTETIIVGDVDRAAGYWKAKIKAGAFRYESAVVDSPAFIKEPVIIEKYTLTVNLTGQTGYTVWVNGSAIVGNTVELDEGTTANVVVVKAGFDISPTSQSVTMDGDKTLTFTASPVVVYRTLTVAVNGLSEPYEIWIDGVEQVGNTFQFEDGTILDNISINIDGYTITPASVASVTMDQDRTLVFEATQIQHTLTIDAGAVTGYDVYIDDVLYLGDFNFAEGEVLTNVSLHKAGYTFSPSVQTVTMDTDKTISFTGTPIAEYELTFNVTGDAGGTSGYIVSIDGVVATAPFVYNSGTVLNNIKLSKAGFTYSPSIVGSVTMDANKTLEFTVLEVGQQVISIHNVAYTTKRTGTSNHSYFRNYTIPNAAGNITLEYGNYHSTFQGDNDGFGEITIKASIKYNGTYYPVNFGGTRSKTLAMGELVISDEVAGLTLPDNATITVITYVISSAASTPGTVDGSGVAAGDFTDSGSPSLSWGGLYSPILIHGVPTVKTPVVVIFGDSNMDNHSWLTKALSENNIPYLNFGFGAETGEMLTHFENYPKRFHYVDSGYFTHSVIAHAANDIYETKNVATITGYLETIYNRVKLSVPVAYCATVTPHTNSTDAWATAANQTPFGGGYETARVEFNNIARVGDFLDGCIDVCQEIEVNASNVLTTNGGRYFIGPVTPPSTDGNHLTDAYASWAGIQLADELPPYFSLLITPEKPTLTADDIANTLSASHALGASEILVSENDGAYTAYAGTISVGDVNRAVGYWKFKTKSAEGRNESAVALSPAFNESVVVTYDLTVNATGPSSFTVFVDGVEQPSNIITVAENTTLENITVVASGWTFSPTSVASILMDGDKSISFTGTIVNVTPDPPTLSADDVANTLSASHALGTSEIVVSENDGPYVAYSGTINTGNENRAIGYWKFKIKAATGRNESAVVDSPAFTKLITLLDGFEWLTLPSPGFTENEPNKFFTNTTKGDTLWFATGGDYMFAIKATGMFSGGFFYTQDNGSSTWAGLYVSNGTYQVSRKGGGSNTNLSPQPTADTYLVLRKVGDVITLEYTLDGISFTLMHTYSEESRAGYDNISYAFGSSGQTVVFPQGKQG